jgi:hypothetical protein
LETGRAADEHRHDRPSWYRLDVTGSTTKIYIHLDPSTEGAAVLPLVGTRTSYLIRLVHPPEGIEFIVEPPEGSEFSVGVRRAGIKDFAQLGAAMLARKGTGRIKFPDGSAYFLAGSNRLPNAELVALLGTYRERNRHERLARRFEIGDLEVERMYPQIDRDWTCVAPSGRPSSSASRSHGPADIAIYIHLFFADQWPDFCHRLSQIDRPFDLLISSPCRRDELEAQIRELFPQAVFHICENRGRDIWPFIHLLQDGVFDRYAAVCKLHTKRSDHLYCGDGQPDFGKRWRRSALVELIGTPQRVDAIADRFGSDAKVGVVGPSNLWLDEPRDSDGWGASKNRHHMLGLSQRLGLDPASVRNNFFAGTMFWFRPRALKAVCAAAFSPSDFEPEPLADEGALPHSMERMFNLIAEAAGFEILGSRDI